MRLAYLCRQDAFTGRNFDHRKGWIRDRLEELAGAFAIDVIGRAESTAARAHARGRRWFQGQPASRLALT